MAESYYSILTSIGKAQIANALTLGTKIDFVKMKVGDSNGSYYNPTESQTDLVHTVWEGVIGHVAIDEENPNWINIEVLIPPDVGGFMIREYGVFDSNNNMLGIAKCPETYKPLPADGSTKELNMKFVLAVTNTSSVTLKIDPTILFAKKKDVDVVQNQVNTIATEIQNARGAFPNLKARLDDSDTYLKDLVYQTAGGTATAITLTINGTLKTGYPITFIASANNGGAATTINSKPVYKPGTTTAPKFIAGKAYTVWYNSSGNNGNGCFFIKASATGTALASQVLKDVPFSNEEETDLIGTLDLSLLVSANIKAGITINGVTGATNVVDTTISSNAAVAANIRAGYKCYVNGALVTGTATEKAAATITPGTTNQTIASGVITTGVQTVLGDPELIASNIVSTANIFGVQGTASISSLGGRRVASGTVTQSATSKTFYTGSGSATGRYYAQIRGLSFVPSTIVIWGTATGTKPFTVYKSTPFYGSAYIIIGQYHESSTASISEYSFQNTGVQLSNGDYDVPFYSTTGSWIAFE